MSGKKNRDKGVRVELDAIERLLPLFPNAKRNWAEQFEHRTGRDILNTPGFCFQVKGGVTPRWKDALAEAIEAVFQEKSLDVPAAITRENRGSFIVHIRLEDFVTVLRGLEDRGRGRSLLSGVVVRES